jgi:hypothetical protein
MFNLNEQDYIVFSFFCRLSTDFIEFFFRWFFNCRIRQSSYNYNRFVIFLTV